MKRALVLLLALCLPAAALAGSDWYGTDDTTHQQVRVFSTAFGTPGPTPVTHINGNTGITVQPSDAPTPGVGFAEQPGQSVLGVVGTASATPTPLPMATCTPAFGGLWWNGTTGFACNTETTPVTNVTAGTGLSGGGAGPTPTLTNAGVTSATGTSNQVTVSASTGAVTFSLPQSINTTAAVQFGSALFGTLANSPASNYVIAARQSANNRPTLVLQRQTDTSPTGNFLSFYDAGSTPALLFNLDITGAVTTGSWTATKIGLAYGGTNADLSATGGTSQVLKQTGVGSAISVARLACADLSNASAFCSGTDAANLTGTVASARISGSYTGITGVGTLTAGTWNATKIGLLYGGTNADLSATGGTSQVLKQVSAGAAITVAQLACADLSNSGVFCSGTDAANLTGTVASARLSGSYTGITGVGTLTAGTWNATTIGSTYGGTGLSNPTAHSLLVAEGASAMTALGVATNGQVPIGSTGADPVLGTLTATANQTGVTNGAGTITLSLAGPHNFTTQTSHGLLLGQGTSAITALANATNGQLAIGSTGADPVLAALTAGANLGVTNAAGSITLAVTDPLVQTQPQSTNPALGQVLSEGNALRSSTYANAPSYANAAKTNSPGAFLRLNETASPFADSSGNSNTCTWVATPTTGVSGAITDDTNAAATFNGSTQACTVATAASLPSGDTFSVEFWVKRTATQSAVQRLVSQGTNGFAIRFSTTNNIELIKAGGATIAASTNTITDTTTWHHVLVTKAVATVHIYIDRSDVTGAVTNATIAPSDASLFVAEASGATNFFPGSLDEVAVYTTALTATDDHAHYDEALATKVGRLQWITDSTVQGLGATIAGGGSNAVVGTYTGANYVVAAGSAGAGTITTGVWNGTKIGLLYGGTNADLSATGGTSQVLLQTSAGAAISVARLACADLSNASAFCSGTDAASLTGTVASARIAGSYTGITGLGTVTAGTWNASTIGSTYGGSGVSNPTAHSLMFAEGASAFATITMAADTLLQGQGTSVDPAAVSVNNCATELTYSTSTHTFGCAIPVTSAIGTSNQVTVSAATGAVTFSLPQNIDTAAAVQFGSVLLGTLANSPAANYVVAARQSANNRPTLILQRQTNTSPTGDFISLYDAAATPAKLFNLDITGAVTTGSWTATKIGLAYGGTNADLSATGGTSQVLKQTSVGGVVTVAQLACADLSNASAFCSGTDAASLTGTVASARIAGSYTGITGVGTLTAGTWNATTIGSTYGGSGVSNPTAHGVLFAEGSSAFTSLTMAADTVLHGLGTSTDPEALAINNCATELTYSTSTHTFGCATPVTSLAGTANEISASASTGAVTLSLIGPHGFSTLTAHSLVLGQGTSAMTALGAATNGQLPIGSTGADPVLAALTAGSNITVTNAAGSITVAVTDPLVQAQPQTAQAALGQAVTEGNGLYRSTYANAPSYNHVVLADTPGGYWRMGEASGNLTDSSGNANTATAVGTATYGVAGAITDDSNNAVTFDGSTNAFTVATAASLPSGDTFSCEFWTKRTATQSAVQRLVSQGTNGFAIRFSTTNNIELVKAGGATIVASTNTITDTTTWHHVLVTKAVATVKVYIDGADVTGTVTNATIGPTDASLFIAESSAGANRYPGSMDETAIYTTALSAARDTAHYNEGLAAKLGRNQAITDSSTTTWGAAITGGSTNKVWGWYNGTDYTVAGK